MKLVFLSRRYLPHVGGVEIHIQQLVRNLGSEYDVTVVTEQHDQDLPQKEKIERVTVLRIPLPQQQTSKFAIWWWWAKHLQLLFSADVIHIHDVFFWLIPFRALIFWKRIFMTFHGYEGTRNPNWKQIIWHQIAETFTSGNLCIGGFHEKWYGVVPNQISYGAVSDLKKKNLDDHNLQEKSKIKIVFVGRLAADTGILVYLEALRILQAKHQVTLDVYGDGPDKKIAEEYVAQYNLNVKFHGFVLPEEIPLEKYDVAFVSRYLAILECFYVGLPVLAQYNVEIKRDYLQLTPFNDWLVIAKTTQEIVEGFNQILQPTFMKKVHAAQGWATEQTWDKLANTYKELWK